jgi:ABC-2 type transport system ATP-binding protein
MLEANRLTKKYGDFIALNDLTLKVNPGEIYCLLGANGAGKSTTINLFLGFIKPSEGEAKINGLRVADHLLETKQFITYIPENLILYPKLSGLENLDYFCGLSQIRHSKDKLQSLLIDSGLQEAFIHQHVSKYSKGMRQKVGIALAIAKNAKVLLLDEPTSGLDPKASNDFGDLLQKMKSKGVATIMATHDLFRAKEAGTHMGIMKHGTLQESFPTRDITIQELEKLYLQHMHD